MDDKDSFDYDDDLGAMSILSGADARRKSFESESGKSARKNKVFQHIKKEMDLRAKVKTVVNPAEQVSSFEKTTCRFNNTFKVYFVDKQRNAAVVIGDRDLKTDVKNKRKRER